MPSLFYYVNNFILLFFVGKLRPFLGRPSISHQDILRTMDSHTNAALITLPPRSLAA